MSIFKKKTLTAEERAAKKIAFEKRVGHKPIWTAHNGNTAEAIYAIPGRNIVVGVRVDLAKKVPEVAEPLWP
jgi:hypothetical protein